MDEECSGTYGRLNERNKIFTTALELFIEYGYESVSVSKLAKKCNVKTSSIYYCGGKEGLLNGCYKFFLKHRYDSRMTEDRYIPILQNGTKDEVINVLNYVFPKDIINTMFKCFILIMERIFIDDKAREVYLNDIDASMVYMKHFFQKGIELGRFEDFDIQAVSLILLSMRIHSAQLATMKEEPREKWHILTERAFAIIEGAIPFKY